MGLTTWTLDYEFTYCIKKKKKKTRYKTQVVTIHSQKIDLITIVVERILRFVSSSKRNYSSLCNKSHLEVDLSLIH